MDRSCVDRLLVHNPRDGALPPSSIVPHIPLKPSSRSGYCHICSDNRVVILATNKQLFGFGETGLEEHTTSAFFVRARNGAAFMRVY